MLTSHRVVLFARRDLHGLRRAGRCNGSSTRGVRAKGCTDRDLPGPGDFPRTRRRWGQRRQPWPGAAGSRRGVPAELHESGCRSSAVDRAPGMGRTSSGRRDDLGLHMSAPGGFRIRPVDGPDLLRRMGPEHPAPRRWTLASWLSRRSRRMAMTAPEIRMAPPPGSASGLVGLPVWMWTERGPQDDLARLDGLCLGGGRHGDRRGPGQPHRLGHGGRHHRHLRRWGRRMRRAPRVSPRTAAMSMRRRRAGTCPAVDRGRSPRRARGRSPGPAAGCRAPRRWSCRRRRSCSSASCTSSTRTGSSR